VSAFVQCFDTGTAPAVGYSRTVTGSNYNSVTNDWAMLENQAAIGNIDLVVRSARLGVTRNFVYQPGAGTYRPHKQALPSVARANIVADILNAGVATIMGVPPGLGVRLGIDRNMDGILDGDTPQPSLRIAKATADTVVAWSTNASGFVLEASPVVPAANWATETSVRGVAGSEFNVTNAPTQSGRFFRLREL
jgi:hypothetical protein